MQAGAPICHVLVLTKCVSIQIGAPACIHGSRQFLPVYCYRTREVTLSIHVALNHVTHYRYDRRVTLSPQIVRLRPAPHCRTRILAYSLKVEPAGHFINWQQDPQANYLARLMFPAPARELRVEVDLTAEMAVVNPFDFFL